MAIVTSSERDIHSAVVRWLAALTGVTVIKAHEGGKTPDWPYITVNLIDTSLVREHSHTLTFAEDVPSERVRATTVNETEWQFSVHCYHQTDAGSPLRRIAAGMQLNQVIEPLWPDLVAFDTSDVRILPELMENAWELHGQMDLFIRGLVAEAFLIDTIEETNLVAGFDLGTIEPPEEPEEPIPAPQIISFNFGAGNYNVGTTATLSWVLSGQLTSVTPVVTDPNGNPVTLTGGGSSRTFTVQQSGTYTATLAVTGPGGNANASKTMTATVLLAPQIASFAFAAGTYNVGDTATIAWALAGGPATSVTPVVTDPLGGTVVLSGSGTTRTFVVQQAGTYSATLAVTGPGGSDNASTSMLASVVLPPAPQITAFAFGAATYNVGDTGTIAWTLGGGPTTSVTPVVTAPGGGTVTLSGSGNTRTFTVAVAGTYSATLLAVGDGGTDSESASMVASVPAGKPIQYLFDHATVTPTAAGSDNQGIVLGFVFFVDAPGKVASVAFYKNANDVQTSRSVAIYNASNQTVVASGVSVGEPVGTAGWVIVPLSAEVALTPGTFYIAAAHSPGLGHYTFRSGTFATPVKRGNITGTAANDPSVPPPLGNGRYKYSTSIAFPDGTAVGSTSYMVDVGFRPD